MPDRIAHAVRQIAATALILVGAIGCASPDARRATPRAPINLPVAADDGLDSGQALGLARQQEPDLSRFLAQDRAGVAIYRVTLIPADGASVILRLHVYRDGAGVLVCKRAAPGTDGALGRVEYAAAVNLSRSDIARLRDTFQALVDTGPLRPAPGIDTASDRVVRVDYAHRQGRWTGERRDPYDTMDHWATRQLPDDPARAAYQALPPAERAAQAQALYDQRRAARLLTDPTYAIDIPTYFKQSAALTTYLQALAAHAPAHIRTGLDPAP